MKKYIRYILTVVIIVCNLFSVTVTAFAGGGDSDNSIYTNAESDEPTDPGALQLESKSAVLMEVASGQVFYEMNANERMSPASITKVMTLLLTMEAIETGKIGLDDMPVCSERASAMGGSQIWLEVGEQMSVDHLLKAVCMASANDASLMLAEHVAGSEEVFVDMMNKRAADLGMVNTNFVNTTGLDAPNHYSTAYDIALMSAELLKHPLIKEYSVIWMDSLRNGEISLVNTNRLVRFYEGATGLKTGTTDGAGKCLSASAERGGMELVAVTLGSDTSDQRFNTARVLLDYGFANWELTSPPDFHEEISPVKVLKGIQETVEIEKPEMNPIIVERGRQSDITYTVDIAEDVEAPVEKGQVLGKISVRLDDQEISSISLGAAESIEKITFFKALGILTKSFINFS